MPRVDLHRDDTGRVTRREGNYDPLWRLGKLLLQGAMIAVPATRGVKILKAMRRGLKHTGHPTDAERIEKLRRAGMGKGEKSPDVYQPPPRQYTRLEWERELLRERAKETVKELKGIRDAIAQEGLKSPKASTRMKMRAKMAKWKVREQTEKVKKEADDLRRDLRKHLARYLFSDNRGPSSSTYAPVLESTMDNPLLLNENPLVNEEQR